VLVSLQALGPGQQIQPGVDRHLLETYPQWLDSRRRSWPDRPCAASRPPLQPSPRHP
jgi:hypothetical protein